MTYRNAKPNEFILKRDSDGRETFETRGVVFAVGGGCGTSDGFWVPGNRPKRGESPFSMQVYVS